MKKLLKRLRSRKGITLAEVVVAMAVVVVITGAALSMLVTSVHFNTKYKSQTYALNACESAVQCIRFADTEAELEGYLAELGFQKDGVNYTLSDSDAAVRVIIAGGAWKVTYNDEVIYEKK